jgi:hypothetical protein
MAKNNNYFLAKNGEFKSKTTIFFFEIMETIFALIFRMMSYDSKSFIYMNGFKK